MNAKRVILPTETESLRPVAGKDLISRITCTPIGINSYSQVVTAERIPNPSVAALSDVKPEAVPPPWWAAGLVGGLLVSSIILWVAARKNRGHKDS